ncbi:MAG: hydroxymethylbilane synthase [Sporolactobacillus sp.]
MRTIHVGSRKSKLALVQSGQVIAQLKETCKDLTFMIEHIVTKGDRILDVTLSKVGGKGLFVKEIERSLLDGQIDFAVHSMKDMPAVLPEGLEIAAIPVREDPADVLVSINGSSLSELPEGARIGTSSLRRAAQLRHIRPDLRIMDLRGNVDTRLAKLQAGNYEAIILAAAGMNRLGVAANGMDLPASLMLPAVGQGALAIECRKSDEDLKKRLSRINDPATMMTVRAERAFLKRLNGGCQVPIAAFCRQDEDNGLSLTGLVASADGHRLLKTTETGHDPEALGIGTAEHLLAEGAGEILAELLGTEWDSDDR